MKKLFTTLAIALLSVMAMAQAPAFPGAGGVARWTTTGGRGGQVIHVTNLNDSGKGSLRAACQASGARIIVFDVSGIISLESTLVVREPNVTILGQTAPGDGICLKNYGLRIAASNVIVRFLRCRMGDEAANEDDAMNAYFHTGSEAENIIFDHCSISWCVDECGSFYGINNFTLQWCTLTESLRNSVHGKGAHGYGGIWGGKNAAFHHNLLAHHDSRNPRFDHDYVSTLKGPIDYVNNVVYNWGSNSSYGGESCNDNNEYKKINMVGNYYKPGPATQRNVLSRFCYVWDTNCDNCTKEMGCNTIVPAHIYAASNYMNNNSEVTSNNWQGISLSSGSSTDAIKENNRFIPEGYESETLLSMHTAETAFSKVLEYAGASYKKDAIDQRIAYEAENGTYTYNGSNGSTGGLIDTQSDVGGWPTYSSKPALTDSDDDGMPDVWEKANGLNPNDASDASAYTVDKSGWYTNIEVYANSLVEELVKQQNADAQESINEYYPAAVKASGVDYYGGDGAGEETGGETAEATSGLIVFGEADIATAAELGETYSFNDGKFVATCYNPNYKNAIDASSRTFGTPDNNRLLTHRLKTGGKAGDITLSIPQDGSLRIFVCTASNAATDRNVVVTQNGQELYNKVVQEDDKQTVENTDGTTSSYYPIVEIPVSAGTVVITYPTAALNFYGFELVTKQQEGGDTPGGGGEPSDEPTPSEGGVTATATAFFPFDLGTDGQVATFNDEGASYFTSSRVTYGSTLSITGTNTAGSTTQTLFQPASQDREASEDNAVRFFIQPALGYKFTPTKVSLKATRYGTDGGMLDIAWQNADNSTISLASGVSPNRNNNADSPFSELTYDIVGAPELEGASGLVVNIYSLGTTKQVGFSDIIIEGIVTGEASDAPVLASFKINGKEYSAEEVFGGKYEGIIELSSSEAMVSSRNPLTDVVASHGEVGDITYSSDYDKSYVTIPVTSGDVTVSYQLTIAHKPNYILSYFNTYGELIMTQSVEKDSKIGNFAIDAESLPVDEGMKIRGWFKEAEGGEKYTTDYVVTEDLSLYAVATEIEVPSTSKKYAFDLTSQYFDANDHEAFNPVGGKWHDIQHGWTFNKGDKIELLVGEKATITFNACQYSNSGSVLKIGDTELSARAEKDGDPVVYMHNGEAGMLTFEVANGGIYLHGVRISNTAETNYSQVGQWYTVNAGSASSFLDALDAVNGTNAQADAPRSFIYLPNGTYDLSNVCLTTISGHNISIIGESQSGVIIKNTPDEEGIAVTATLRNTGSNNYLQDLTIQNAWDYYGKMAEGLGAGRAVCLWDRGTNTICKNVTMLSYQDTYYTNNNDGQFYWETSDIHGTVDFICGGGTLFMENSTITVEPRNPDGRGECVITAPYTAVGKDYGYVFNNCFIDNKAASYSYGRAWGGEPRCAWLNTKVNDNLIRDTRFTTAGMNVAAKEFVEYNTTDLTGTVVSPASNVLTFTHSTGDYTYETILTSEQAAKYNINKVFTDWQPAALTVQAAPVKGTWTNGAVTWNDNATVAIYKNGELIDIVTDANSYPIDVTSQQDMLTIRTANSMGGFSEATIVDITSGGDLKPMGDVNNDGEVNSTDIVVVIDYIIGLNPENFNAEAADINKDGNISVTDVIMLIDMVLYKTEM